MTRLSALFLLLIWPGLASAMALELPPGATKTFQKRENLASYEVPIGPYSDGAVESLTTEGEILRQAWRFKATGGNTLAEFAPLRQQLLADNFTVLYECAARACGGFDFRFASDILPAPEMYVDLDNYRFLSARRDGANSPEFVTLLVSASETDTFVQMIQVGPPDTAPRARATSTKQTPANATALEAALLERGRYVLEDLRFTTGSATLDGGSFGSLSALSDFLKADPKRKIVLVGHTDDVGSLTANIDLSRKRATSVAEALITNYGADRAQISADGVGYLAPLDSNLTTEGRKKNRRVEVVLTPSP